MADDFYKQYLNDEIEKAALFGKTEHADPAVVHEANARGIPMRQDRRSNKPNYEFPREADSIDAMLDKTDNVWAAIPWWIFPLIMLFAGLYTGFAMPTKPLTLEDRAIEFAVGFIGSGILLVLLRIFTKILIILAIVAAIMLIGFLALRDSF